MNVTEGQLKNKDIDDFLNQAFTALKAIRESKEIVEFRRKPLPGGGEYVVEEVVGYRPK